jgi:hypothetical protein
MFQFASHGCRESYYSFLFEGTPFKSVPYADLGACIDYNAQVLAVKKLLSAMAHDAAKNMKSH